jgi:hypothetical protein
MDNVLMGAYEIEEKKAGFLSMIPLIIFRPRLFFKETVARDRFPYLTLTAWLLGLAMALQLMASVILRPGGLVTGRMSSFLLLLVMSVLFMGFFYLIGGVLFHFYAYLADSRKDMKNSLAVSMYAWMPFVLVVFVTKLGLVIAFGGNFLTAQAESPVLNMIISGLVGLSILYGWFLAIYGAIISLGCKKLRAILMLAIVPLLWFVMLFLLFRYLGLF